MATVCWVGVLLVSSLFVEDILDIVEEKRSVTLRYIDFLLVATTYFLRATGYTSSMIFFSCQLLMSRSDEELLLTISVDLWLVYVFLSQGVAASDKLLLLRVDCRTRRSRCRRPVVSLPLARGSLSLASVF